MREWLRELWAVILSTIEAKFAVVWVPALWAIMSQIPYDGIAALFGLVILDNVFGTMAAFMSATFRFARWRHSLWKLYTVAMVVLAATLLRCVHGMQGAFLLHWTGDYIVLFSILTETVSCFRNLMAIMILQGIRVPGFSQLVTILEAINRNSLRRMARLLGGVSVANVTRKLEENETDGTATPND